MAALRIFARSNLSAILRASTRLESIRQPLPAVIQVHKRWGGYKSSPIVEDPSQYTDYEVSKDPIEWEYVERLLVSKTIPQPPLDNKKYPSGWAPPTAKPGDYPYFVQRTKNHMQPVYLLITFRGMRRVTHIRKIEGNIWQFKADLLEYLSEQLGTDNIGIKVNELIGAIKLRGDYVSLVKAWFDMKGF